MKTLFNLKSMLFVAAIVALPMADAATMSRLDYKAGKTRIDTDYKVDKTACGALAGNAKDICIEEAKAKQKVASAELEYGYTGKPADQNKVQVAKAEAIFAVARERCDDKAGNVKDVCVQEAKAEQTKSLADAKMGQQIGAARSDAAVEKLDADYKVEAQKCDAMAGDAMAACMNAAKARFGK